ncbi:hypothetical protein [Pedobacter sp. JY14-1]|uniref:hypothetical protein n=1 Tax=Pedobacter sp. JY14-1 TaxID=3034151 RepID=UPI0023E2C7B4|nr:hypothetical protein [Pedobacter sp. JY14-1]
MKEAYFLRGGINVGCFRQFGYRCWDAIGKTLNLLESKMAFFPKEANNQFDDRQMFIRYQIMISDEQ